MIGVVVPCQSQMKITSISRVTCPTYLSLPSTPSFGYITGKKADLTSNLTDANCCSNVDRLIALWQILHDNSWFDGTDPRDEDPGTFAIQRGNRDTPQDILRPFRKNSHGDYWTSVDAREVTALGYTYPGLEKWRYTKPDGTYDKERHRQEIIRPFNTKYNSAWSAAEKAELTADPGQLDGVSLMSLNSLQEVTKREPIDLTINDYVVNVIYEK